MKHHSKIDPAETYVLEEEDLAELEDVGLTGIVKALTDFSERDKDADPADSDS